MGELAVRGLGCRCFDAKPRAVSRLDGAIDNAFLTTARGKSPKIDNQFVDNHELRLGGVAAQYTALAQLAAEKRSSFTDFAEELLTTERESRRARAREMFARIT